MFVIVFCKIPDRLCFADLSGAFYNERHVVRCLLPVEQIVVYLSFQHNSQNSMYLWKVYHIFPVFYTEFFTFFLILLNASIYFFCFLCAFCRKNKLNGRIYQKKEKCEKFSVKNRKYVIYFP